MLTSNEVQKEDSNDEKSNSSNPKSDQSGIDRVKLLFQQDEYGEFGPDVTYVIQTGSAALLIGAAIGGMRGSMNAVTDYKNRNQGTLYGCELEAQRKFQDKLTVSMMRNSFSYAWKIGLFTTSFMMTSTIISSYRNKTSVLDFTGAGFICGALYRFHMGFSGMLAGTFVGTVFGTTAGLLACGLLKLSGRNMEDIRQLHYSLAEKYNERKLQLMLKSRKKHIDKLSEMHDEMVKNVDNKENVN